MTHNNEVRLLLERYEKVIELGREINRGISDHESAFRPAMHGRCRDYGSQRITLVARDSTVVADQQV